MLVTLKPHSARRYAHRAIRSGIPTEQIDKWAANCFAAASMSPARISGAGVNAFLISTTLAHTQLAPFHEAIRKVVMLMNAPPYPMFSQ